MRAVVLAALTLAACKGGEGPIDTDFELPIGGELLGVGVAPRDPVAAVGESVPFFATAYYENTSYEDITAEVIWTSTDTRVATVDAAGVALALAEGEVNIIAVAPGGATNQVKLTVLAGGVTTTGVSVEPAAASLNVGQTVQLAPVATYSDGTTGTVGAACTWTTTDGGVATVSASGLAAGAGVGNATVQASCGSFQASAALTVVAADVDLGDPNLVITYFDGFDVSGDVVWFVDVTNQGDAASSGFFVDVVLDGSGPPAAGEYDASSYVSGLSPGETAALTLELEDAPTGTFDSWVAADVDGFVAESNESDNADGPVAIALQAAAIGPDLAITDVGVTSDGFDTLYIVTVENLGDQAAYDFWIDLWQDEVAQPAACAYGDHYVNVASLDAGASYEWELIVEEGPAFFWESWVWVDACDEVGDADPSDNVTSVEVIPEF